MAKTILVPTDFSENAKYAAQYACKLARKNNLAIELYHCYTTTSSGVNSGEETSPLLEADILILEWKKDLQTAYPHLEITTSCVAGLLSETVPLLTQSGNYALVIMGTTGAGKGKSLIWGSNTSSIVYKSAIPVLAIPNKYSGFNFEKVAMLTNFKSEELETLTDYVSKISTIPELHLIHVYKDPKTEKQIEQQLDSWSFNIKEINGISLLTTNSAPIRNQNSALDTIPEVILHIIEENNYDIILVTKTRKSFFERLFRASVSKQIALNLNRPTFFDNN